MTDASLKNRWENEINISPVEARVSFNQGGRHTPMCGELFGEMRSTEYSGEQSWGQKTNEKGKSYREKNIVE